MTLTDRISHPDTGNRIRMITQDAETEQPVERRNLVKGCARGAAHHSSALGCALPLPGIIQRPIARSHSRAIRLSSAVIEWPTGST